MKHGRKKTAWRVPPLPLHRLIDTLEVNRIDELRTIAENQEEYRKKLETAFEEMGNTMEAMAKCHQLTYV